MTNIYSLPAPLAAEAERVDILHSAEGVRIERIVSAGQRTPDGEWYDQSEAEWVALLQGEASIGYENGDVVDLRRGDWLYIPPRCRHRVERTSAEPACIWLAVFVGTRGTGDIQGHNR